MVGIRAAFLIAILASAGRAGGLGRLEFNSEDVIVVPGQRTLFAAALERKFTLAAGDDIEDAVVDFYFAGRRVGSAVTDRNGTAKFECEVAVPKDRPGTYRMAAFYKSQWVEGSGRIFYWSPTKTIIAVDVDETISHTHYSDLFIADVDKYSRPLDGSPKALWKLSRDYELLYISARPRFLNQKTRDWLKAKGFPPGPVANALKFEACLHQRRYKQEMLEQMRRRFPNLLIGVGDKGVDERVYGANQMVGIIVDKHTSHSYRDNCIVFANWDEISAFFDRQRPRLVDSAKLSTLIADSDMDFRSAFAAPPIQGEPVSDAPVTRRAAQPTQARSVVEVKAPGDIRTP